MRRWHNEKYLMLNRYKQELRKHTNNGQVQKGCHCLKGLNFMRKRRPHDSHGPNQHCTVCEIERQEQRRYRRRERHKVKTQLRFVDLDNLE